MRPSFSVVIPIILNKNDKCISDLLVPKLLHVKMVHDRCLYEVLETNVHSKLYYGACWVIPIECDRDSQ